jgi:hypothetical protein
MSKITASDIARLKKAAVTSSARPTSGAKKGQSSSVPAYYVR